MSIHIQIIALNDDTQGMSTERSTENENIKYHFIASNSTGLEHTIQIRRVFQWRAVRSIRNVCVESGSVGQVHFLKS